MRRTGKAIMPAANSIICDLFRGCPQAANTELGDLLEMGHRRDVAECVAVGIAQIGSARCIVSMRIELQDMDGLVKGAYRCKGD